MLERKTQEKINVFAYALFAISFIVLGICFIVFAIPAGELMCYAVGGIAIFLAALNAILALIGKKRDFVFVLKITLCVLALAGGIVTMICKDVALEYIIAAVAFALIVETTFKLQIALKMRAVKSPLWWTFVVLIIACYAGSGYLLKFYVKGADAMQAMMIIFGITLLVDGVLNLLAPFCTPKDKRDAELDVAADGKERSKKISPREREDRTAERDKAFVPVTKGKEDCAESEAIVPSTVMATNEDKQEEIDPLKENK